MNGSGRTDMNESSSKSTALITRDLLGGCCTIDSKELDLDLKVPSGWKKRLDLKSGKVYLQRSNSSNNQTVGKFQDFNSPPASKLPLSLFHEDTKLELKPITSSSTSSPSSSSVNYHSVCTLEKVKSALERAEKQSTRKRSTYHHSMSMASSSVMSMQSSSSSPKSNSSISSIKNIIDIDQDNSSDNAFAAGCPSCLLCVLISRTNPRCPRCNTIVSSPVGMKKPRIDLNISM
ncbi:hypothetical protein K7X08_022807 [Anisodus acutangulus]|uniref:GIR1-like zinc ribbon domain-containing protein n=1 Tax=Anisodus acutangulus TaxID=402998 RepID=A0A9Q1MBR8_9SOLA|nr:hypothetical protein K7X08_022807 [Anisodus acutangulus]